MNASTESAEEGYGIYLRWNMISYARLNKMLVKKGLDPISERMWRHYANLDRVGLTRYIPINRFDVLRAKEGGVR